MCSSIEHGGTGTFSNMWYFRGKFSWYFCEVNLCVTIFWYFCEVFLVAGGCILFSLHMTMVWDLTNGPGIQGIERKLLFAQANNELRAKTGMGNSRSTAGPKARGPTEQTSESRCLCKQTTSYKQ